MTTAATRGRRARASGDRSWADAAASTISDLAAKVRTRAKDVRDGVPVEAVHDTRTATRRLRTAITIYGHEAGARDRRRAEKQLKRLARRLGSVRDLDVLLASLPAVSSSEGRDDDGADLKALRDAWTGERDRAARRLQNEVTRRRLRRTLKRAERLVAPLSSDSAPPVISMPRIASRAPALIWARLGDLLVFEIDPVTADPAAIHQMRIAAKKLRYTLEAFEDALEPGRSLIVEVTALQDAGGEMHDAIVARDRARSMLDGAHLGRRQRSAIEAFAVAQDRRAESCRPVVAKCLATVRSRAFRESLGRATAGMGHIRGPARTRDPGARPLP